MSIQRTEAVILRSIPFGETSKIVTALTRDHGKVSLIARGARDVKSKYGGSLELFTHVQVIFYERETRDMQYLSDVAVIDPFLRIRDDLPLTYTALSIIEICQRAVHGNETTKDLFDASIQALKMIEENPKRAMMALITFLVLAADHLGFRLDVTCDLCPDVLSHDTLGFNIEKGCLSCEACPTARRSLVGHIPLSKEAAAVLGQVIRTRGMGILNVAMSPSAGRELFNSLVKHLQYHVEELQGLQAIRYVKA